MPIFSLRRGLASLAPTLPFLVLACGGSEHGCNAPSGNAAGGSGGFDSITTGSSAGSNPGGGGDGNGNGGSGGSAVKGTTMRAFTGSNANIADDPANLTPIGWVRDYHNWGWICGNYASGPAYPDMLYTFNLPENGWSWDDHYKAFKDAGVQAFPAVQGSVPWLGNAFPPAPSGADKTAAASYIAHGDTMFQIAARYGSTKVDDAKLKLRNDQSRLSGLGYMQYFEDFNEQDNAQGFTGDVFAAMASADYDGDQKRLGDTIGVKNADPKAKLVMGGLSGRYPTTGWVQSITEFLDAMRTWSTAHRGGDFPADVINVHLYSFSTDNGASPAPSPEADHIKDKLAAITAYRDQNLPGKELWWTEFGYDTQQQSVLRAPPLGSNSEFIVQGQWIVRDFLAALAAGFDKATMFELDDTCDIEHPSASCIPSQQFTTCGLIDGKHVKKPSWYFVATFNSRLATMVFDKEITSGDPDVMVYRFQDTKGGGGAYVVWAPTSSAKVVPGYALAVGGAGKATLVTLTDKEDKGVESKLTVTAGKTQLDVSETPAIVLVDAL